MAEVELKEGAEPEATNPSEVAQKWLESDEGRAWLQPTLDRTVAKALKTHDEKQAPEIERRIKEAEEAALKKGSMSEAERMNATIAELQKKFEQAESKAAKQERDTALLSYATQTGVPTKLIADLLANPGATLDSGKASIDAIAEGLEEIRKQTANAQVVNGSHKPGSGGTGEKEEMDYSNLDWSNPEDRSKLLADAEKRLSK